MKLTVGFFAAITLLMGIGAAIMFLGCAALGLVRPPVFADPVPRVVDRDEEDCDDDVENLPVA